MKDESEVPFKTNEKLKKKLNTKSKYKRILKSVPVSAVACLVIGAVVTSVMLNDGTNNADDISYIPIAVNEKIISTDISG